MNDRDSSEGLHLEWDNSRSPALSKSLLSNSSPPVLAVTAPSDDKGFLNIAKTIKSPQHAGSPSMEDAAEARKAGSFTFTDERKYGLEKNNTPFSLSLRERRRQANNKIS